MAKAQDISVRQVGPKSAKRSISFAIKKRRPVFLWGPPGIGKSDIVKQIGEDAGREVVDVRLALWEPTDIKGIPYYNADQGKMVWARSEQSCFLQTQSLPQSSS
jgi:MoxR-like ATPase